MSKWIFATLVSALGLLSFCACSAEVEDLKPIMCARGKELFKDDFSGTALSDAWKVAKGKWEIVDGAMKGTELKDDAHPAVIRHDLECKNIIAQFSFKFAGGKAVHLSLNNAGGHVCRVVVTPAGFTLKKDIPKKGSTEKAETLGNVKMEFKDGQWYTILVEICGKEMLAMVDESHVAFGESVGVDVDKKNVSFPVSGESVFVDNLKIWEATLSPEWEATKKKLSAK